MDIQKIKELALANGFKLKEQASGNMDLNAYIYDFANAIEQATKAQAVPEGFAVVPIETLDEALSWASCASSESWSDAQREEIDKHYEVIENAMIEAQEQKG